MELLNEDLKWCVKRLPLKLKNMMVAAGPEIVVAGGFIRSCVAGEEIRDVDVFTRSKEKADEFSTKLATHAEGPPELVYKTDNANTVKCKPYSVQFIHRWTFEKPENVISSFDFTVACSALWHDNGWKSLCHDRFYADLAAKRLVYCKPERNEDAGGSMLRVLKFYQRGYRIPLDSLGAVIARLCMGIKPDDGLNGIAGETLEIRTGRLLTGLLLEVDPNATVSHDAFLPASTEVINENTGE